MFVIRVEAIKYLLLCNLHDYTFDVTLKNLSSYLQISSWQICKICDNISELMRLCHALKFLLYDINHMRNKLSKTVSAQLLPRKTATGCG